MAKVSRTIGNVPIISLETHLAEYHLVWMGNLMDEARAIIASLWRGAPLLYRGTKEPDIEKIAMTGIDWEPTSERYGESELIYVAPQFHYAWGKAKTALLIYDGSKLKELVYDAQQAWNELDFKRYEFQEDPKQVLLGMVHLAPIRQLEKTASFKQF